MSTNRVKITMIGGKNAGKTCFLHAMYNVMRRGVHNFFLHAHDGDTDNRLMRTWSNMYKAGAERRWPLPTNETLNRYDFSFKLGMKRSLFDVEWIDYRGGALMEESFDNEELVNELNDSDCLFFCLDGAELQTPVADRLYEVDNQMCISRAKVILDGLQRRVPIAVLITKHDMCRHRLKEELLADIRTLFDAWLVPGEGWDVLICPTTLGAELASDIKEGEIAPRNLHVPLVYAAFSFCVEQLVGHEGRARDLQQQMQAIDKKSDEMGSGFMSTVFNPKMIAQAEALNDELEHCQRMLAAEERAMHRIRKDVGTLGQVLGSAVMYCDGKRVKITAQPAGA